MDVSADGPILDPSDPYAREAQTFPRLAPEMMQRLAAYGTAEDLAEGTVVFERGQRSVDFFVVVAGAIEIYDRIKTGEVHVLTAHAERQFTGELDLFNDREILVSGRARAWTRVVRVKRPDFRRLVSAETDIGEIIMRAFILRRVGLIRHAQGGVVLIGPGHRGDTLRLQRFLTRNGYPHRSLDTDVDPDAEGFLEGFSLGAADLPVVVTPDQRLLRNPSSADPNEALTASAKTPRSAFVMGSGANAGRSDREPRATCISAMRVASVSMSTRSSGGHSAPPGWRNRSVKRARKNVHPSP